MFQSCHHGSSSAGSSWLAGSPSTGGGLFGLIGALGPRAGLAEAGPDVEVEGLWGEGMNAMLGAGMAEEAEVCARDMEGGGGPLKTRRPRYRRC